MLRALLLASVALVLFTAQAQTPVTGPIDHREIPNNAMIWGSGSLLAAVTPGPGVQFNAGTLSTIATTVTVLTGTTHAAPAGDSTVLWQSATSGGKTETIPVCASGNFGTRITVKDNQGSAAVGAITVIPVSGTIDGAANLIIATNRGVARLQCDGAGNWMVM